MIWYGLSGLEICCESVLKYEIVKALPISSGQRLADATAKFHQEPEEPDETIGALGMHKAHQSAAPPSVQENMALQSLAGKLGCGTRFTF